MPSPAVNVVEVRTSVEAILASATVPEEMLVPLREVSDAPDPENKAAVIVFPEKLAEASLATILLTAEVAVASTAHVVAVEPLKLVPVKYAPLVRTALVLAVIVMLPEPLNDTPLIVLAVWSVVAVSAFPVNAAVIVLAAKFPRVSLATIFEAVAVVVASTAQVVAVEPSKFEPVRYVPRVSVVLVLAVTVMFAEPLKDTPLIVLAVWNVVAVVALPERAAVMVFAAKLEDESLATTFEAVAAGSASTDQVLAVLPSKSEPVR